MVKLFASVRPNTAHVVLSELEKLGILKTVVTQNIDSLHQRAGSLNVVEFHGHFRSLHCDTCLNVRMREEVDLDSLPPLCSCGGMLRPDIVFFGEGIPRQAYADAIKAAERCADAGLGTSANVAPATQLPALEKGGAQLRINPVATELSY